MRKSISLQALFICLCVCVYVCAIFSLLLLNPSIGYESTHASGSRYLSASLLRVDRGGLSFGRCGIDRWLKEARSWGCNIFCSLAFVFFDAFFRHYNMIWCIWEFEVHMRWGTPLLNDLSDLLISLSEEKFEWIYLRAWCAYEVRNSSFEWFECSLSILEWRKIWVDILESLRCIWGEKLLFWMIWVLS